MSNDKKTLYERLGGYNVIAAVANDLAGHCHVAWEVAVPLAAR
jgi:hypothetical protein